ncbi:MAG: ubiquitin-conjugating enzyme E2 [Anaerolineae bacterium]|nr:ubiquitin-conjugating enzyme E2 [Anaerolineae bacterium]MCO5190169.1 ubiquitin-conjugating enzyme E2 [Anaerolineae bacterium]MCO5195200.1 ubiquitin-conjugating enzyme E2 [Anaerolineae bacterium]MCO5199377.1 ubiquitin-conjugating enzyme E2 [Anaerolineae bacterium]MCO5204863.1 ubiquitin-conjugating enzyme E2 [Anaerolineae bacterium]
MSFDIREARLRNDYARVRDLVNRSDLIYIIDSDGDPPERYRIRYTCRSVEKLMPNGTPKIREVHDVAIYLHAEYPLKQPQLKWLTPIFHPNIHITGAVCIGAWWPAKTLDELLLTLGEMIQYKNLDPKDPMNSKAAAWSIRNRHLFPIDNRDLKGQSLQDMIVLGEPEADDLGINILG